MTLKFFILTLSLSGVYAAGFSQSTLSVSFHDQPLERVLNELEEQSDYTFVYREGLLDGARVQEAAFMNATLEEILNTVLIENGFAYNLTENQIVVVRKEALQPQQPLTITGSVRDSDNNPIPGASVMVKGTQQGTATNAQGLFTLTVTGNREPVLSVSFLGKKVWITLIAENSP
ncbi:MAG: carboxypeptidase-like regulatory domain-containing protein [Rikenellaceae bacterium]|nr:carboxypeptidase-like regulatory domain-containing protein [Rikenellaceae bacterium]